MRGKEAASLPYKDCYGTHNAGLTDCRRCAVRTYCRDFTLNDRRGDLGERKSDVPGEVAAALSRFALLPEVYETPDGHIGQTFHLVSGFCRWMTTLSAQAFRLVRLRLNRAAMSRTREARALGVGEASVYRYEKEIFQKMGKCKRFFVFVSGPMTGLPDFNRPAFYQAEEDLQLHLAEPVNPAYLGLWLADDAPREAFLDICRTTLRHCQGIYMLKGWQASEGARAERDLAQTLGLHVWYEGETPLAEIEKTARKWAEKNR